MQYLKDLRAIAHATLNQDDPFSGFEAWEEWKSDDLPDDVSDRIEAYVNDEEFKAIKGGWLAFLLHLVFLIKRAVYGVLFKNGLAPFQVEYRVKKFIAGR